MWYYHTFSDDEPDLNLTNKFVLKQLDVSVSLQSTAPSTFIVHGKPNIDSQASKLRNLLQLQSLILAILT